MKRALSVFSVLLIGLIASASTVTTRFFLSELDFMSNHPVPESSTRFKPHISADYDENNNIFKKFNVDSKGDIKQIEIFSYDSLGILKSKDIYLSENFLEQKMLFGLESKAVDYIEYVYGVDTVKDWTDRFSILDYNELNQLTNHAFFDVNAFLYGNAHYEYDSLGYLSKEEWIRQPSGKTMRWWNHYFDPVTHLTRIMEYDSNGVLVQDFRLSPDGTESIFWFTSLEDSAKIKHTNLSFKNESNLKWGKIIWYKVDSAGVYVDSVDYLFSKKFLNKGNFESNLSIDSVLVDSAQYDIVFKGIGKSGYNATQRKILGVTFDISPPVMDLFAKSFINEPKISYNQSESLTAAHIEWHAIHDSSSIISVEFDSSDLLKFGGELFKPTNQLPLEDSVFYRIYIYGTDYAGNISIPTFIDSIMFDIQPPKVEFISPLNSEYRNYTSIDWIMSEPIQSWKIDIKSITGTPDINAPHSFQSDSSLYSNVPMFKELSDEFQLNDGTVYRFELSVIDRAGNTSIVFEVDSVTYDITPPLITTIYPETGSSINVTNISYNINEPLRAGEFRWEQTEGTMDSSAPHIIPLINDELRDGDHIQVELFNQTALTDGAVYTLMITGMDRAGNVGPILPNTDILFDAVPPEFTNVFPISGSALNHQHISYTLSEKVKTGSVTWTWVDGIKDNDSPHISPFKNSEDNGGVHDSLLLTMNPPLVDGGIYNIEFNAADRAGNIAESILVENVLYDFTSPIMSLFFPTGMSFLRDKNFSYTLSETINVGTFFLERKGGKNDPKSPYEIPLTTQEKSGGKHKNVFLLTMPDVVEGSIYKLSFTGRDRAGNFTAPISLPGIQYDFTPPELSLLSLPDSTDINYMYISYDLSEILKEGAITWERTGGTADSKRIHMQSLLEGELLNGVHMKTYILNSPNLKDGAVYSISISGKDRAGNESNIPIAHNIKYDITAPEIDLSHPMARSYVSTPAITYTLNEKLYQGKIIYNHIGGTPDPNAPYEIEMGFVLRQKGEHNNVLMDDGPDLKEGSVYTISIIGNDRAGNEAEVAIVSGVIYDATPPILTIQTSDSSLSVNHNHITFSKNEDLASGTIIWSRKEGRLDSSSPHRVILNESELQKGIDENFILSNAPYLTDGAIYDISFKGTDFAGNQSEMISMSGVVYDISPPILNIISPGNNYFTNGSELTFSHSENLESGLISWSGRDVNETIYVSLWKLNNDILKKGIYDLNDFYNPELIDGRIYTITFSGQDPAGNKAQPVQISQYTVDRTKPIFSSLLPKDSSFVNKDYVGYVLNENLESGLIILKSNKEEQKIDLIRQELIAGDHPLQTILSQPQWIDGSNYSVKFIGTDFAGNVSDTVSIKNLIYDISPPKLEVTAPITDSYINEMTMDLMVNEPLFRGQIIWEPLTGELVHKNLLEEHLNNGEHQLEYRMEIEENISYSVYIQGVDRAGNIGQSISIENVIYDVTNPEIEIVAPLDGSTVNHDRVSYTLSERLLEGKMIWQDLSGLDEKLIHEVILNDNELLAGEHLDATLNKIPELIGGASYMIRLEGSDLAGNSNEAVPVQSYTYDSSPPEFTQLAPSSGLLVNTVNLGFVLNEDLAKGRIVFTQIEGTQDINSPHIVHLSGSRLKKGEGGGILPKEVVELINGSIYDIEFFGEDLAGNVSAETKISNISYDDEAPVVFIKSPTNNINTNILDLGYLIGEDMVDGQIKITIDNSNEIIILLDDSQRMQGEYTQFIPDEITKLNDSVTLNFELSGHDAAGNMSIPHKIENVKYDTTHPIIIITNPISDSAIKQSFISYSINEDLAEGFLIATQTGGVFDSRSPQRIPLLQQELKLGNYEDVFFTNGPRMVNGSIYSFEFSGKDYAGNEVQSSKVENVLFDNEAPVVSLIKPIDTEQIKTTDISYMLSDNLSKGLVTFEHVGGTTDLVSPHIVELSGSQLKQGFQQNIDMQLMDLLSDGARYKVSIQGWDRAGNESQISSVKNVLFDVLPPNLAIHEPINGSSINEPIVSFEMNEKLAEGTLTFTRTGGNPDINSPHDVLMLPPFNSEGRFDQISLANDVILQDGSEYTITFNALDPAGNISIPVSVSNIFYDITVPVIETIAPLANSYLRNMNVIFSINEQLVMGQIKITQTLGTHDPNSPHLIQLTDNNLQPSQHQVNILETASFISGAEYSVQIFGQDRAGNSSASLEIGQLVYDIEPPVLDLISPTALSKVNHTKLAFSVGEMLQSLNVSWIDENGNESKLDLPEKYYSPDRFDQVVLKIPPELISGNTYSIILSGIDLAENQTETVIEGIEFDDTPPIFTGLSPFPESYVNEPNIQFSTNEPLQSGRVIWKASGGSIDPQSPQSVELVGEELTNGMLSSNQLINQKPLNDGTIYDLSIEGIDLAGNLQLSVLFENIRYDISPPLVDLLSPTNDSFLNHDNLEYNLDENMKSAILIWKRIFGSNDPTIHRIDLSDELLNKGQHSNSELPDLPLVHGAKYEIELSGVDLAGNKSTVSSKRIFFYDTAPPVLTIDSPEDLSFINHLNFNFTVSEPIQSGEIIYTDENGKVSNHYLSENELNILVMIEDPLTIPLNLKDGSTYSIKLIGIDFAGNYGESKEINDINYDVSKPVISIFLPEGDDVYVGSNISYSLSETIKTGTAIWSREGGKPDPLAPHIIQFNVEEKKLGEHVNLQLANQSRLNVSTIYSLTMKGSDTAGNTSLPISVRDIEHIRSLNGNWFFQGAIMTVVWGFEEDPESDGRIGTFFQGIQLGTKISNQEYGRYEIDYSSKPWTLRWTMDKSSKSRISIFEFQDENHLRVVTRDRKKPKNWSDGEVMLYEYR